MRLLVWRVVNKTLKFRLTFLILLTINFPLPATGGEKKSLFPLLVTVKLKPEIRKIMGGWGGEVQKKYSRKGKLNEKKIPARQLILKNIHAMA